MADSLGSYRPRRGVILEVPFEEKEAAKQLGAWWDTEIKKWFVPQGKDPAPFKKWFPEEAISEKKVANQ